MMARSTLQRKAGYIDARPLTTGSTKSSCYARPDHTCGSFASGSGRPPLQPCPLCPESDGRPPKCDRSRWAIRRHMQCSNRSRSIEVRSAEFSPVISAGCRVSAQSHHSLRDRRKRQLAVLGTASCRTASSDEARFLVGSEPAGFENFVRALGEPAQTRSLPSATGLPSDCLIHRRRFQKVNPKQFSAWGSCAVAPQ